MSSASIADGWEEGLCFELFKEAEKGLGTDVIFEVGSAKKVFNAHQFLIGYGSPRLKSILEELPDRNGKKIVRLDADHRSFRYLLKGMYDWKSVELSHHENDYGLVMSTFRLANRFEVKAVTQKYCRFFINDVKRRTLMRMNGLIPQDEGQVIQCLNEAVRLNIVCLKKAVTKYLCRFWIYITTVEGDDDWLKLSVEAFQEVLIRDSLVHWSEIFIYEDVRRWIQARIDGVPGVQSRMLIRAVRFPLMTVKELSAIVTDNHGLLDMEDITWIQEYMAGTYNKKSFLRFSATDRVDLPLPLPKNEPSPSLTP